MKKGKESKDKLLRSGGRPLAETLSESLRQLEVTGAAYLHARENGRAKGVLSKKRDIEEKYDVPPAFEPPVQLFARRVVETRLSPRNIRGISLRVQRVRCAAEVSVFEDQKLVALKRGVGSAIAGGFTVGKMSGADYRRGTGKAGGRELDKASRRKRRVEFRQK